MRMRMSTVYLVRRTLGILVVILVLVSLYWNYKLHATKKKQLSQPPLESLTQRDEVSALKKGKTSSHKNRGTTTTRSAVTHATTRGPPTRLLQKLSQLEARLNQSHAISMLIFHDPENILRSKVSLYGLSQEKKGYKVKVVSNLSQDGPDSIISSSWSGIMCFSQRRLESHPCLIKNSLTKLKLHQKVSYIPGLDKILILPDKLCYTMSAAHHLPALTSSPLSVPCSVLPSKSKSISEKVFKSLDNTTLFLIKPSEEASSHITFTRMLTVGRMLQIKGVLHAIRRPLFIDSQPVIIKTYVLITSMTPLRVFRHHDGSAVIMTQDKGIKESWTLHQVDVYLSESFSAHDVSRAWRQVDDMIVKSLMISESSLHVDNLKMKLLSQSSHFFQLLEFYFTFNSSLHPFLLEVKPTLDGSTSPDVVKDTIQLVFGATSSVRHVHEMLQKLNKTIGVEGLYCSQQHKICLDESELVYVIENHRQTTALGRFKKLYPTSESNKFQQLLDDLLSAGDNSLDSRLKTHKRRSTPQLHSVLIEMESYREGFASDVPHVDQRKGYWETDDDDYPDKISPDSSSNVHRRSRPKCDEDSSADPVLTAIHIDPTSADFTRAFNPEITEYDVTFPFDVAVVKIWGAATCGSGARVNSVTGTSGPANYSVGVGWNKFAIHLVDTSLEHPSVIVTYDINIYRRRRSNQHKPFSDSATHEVCSLKQDCDLKAFPGLHCGPQKISEKTMNELLESRINLPWCENGDAPGSWVFPCANCSDPSSCFWREAKWIPDSCTHNILSSKDAKTCLANKKILFVGDSTNRGIMYYLMEKINGSLQQWEKTHSMKVYSSALNDGKTSVSFAYYPQFWLPTDRKPVFLKALQHLMARFMPLTNSTNTILVVGGVQWLLPSHVMAIKTTVSSLGLGGIKVIIKTLGSGFHLPVPGFVKLNLEGQQKVAQRNQMVMKAARIAGFEVVDTHAMTVARYKEFLMGKCGCHFHKVVDLRSHQREDDEIPSTLLNTMDSLPRYHVIGPINSAYSDIIISRMCS